MVSSFSLKSSQGKVGLLDMHSEPVAVLSPLPLLQYTIPFKIITHKILMMWRAWLILILGCALESYQMEYQELLRWNGKMLGKIILWGRCGPNIRHTKNELSIVMYSYFE